MTICSYGDAIRKAFEYLLENHPEVFVIGQGVWSPWYVGSTMSNLEKKFGKDRVIDTPVSELACTGLAIGASLSGYRPIVIHPRMDFMLLATDQIVNQAAKWAYMFSGKSRPAVTIRSIINRGGEQGAQHSQALHSLYAHIPGLRVVMPATVQDAYDLLIASVLCDDPVLYIDDKWLYEQRDELRTDLNIKLSEQSGKVLVKGDDITIVSASYSTHIARQVVNKLQTNGVRAELIDLRVVNPIDDKIIIESVRRTGALCVIDGGWSNCGLAGEIIARVSEKVEPSLLKHKPVRCALPDVPAPTSSSLEKEYYPTVDAIYDIIYGNIFKRVVEKI